MVDEIHERGMNEDFLLIILRDVLPRRPDLKLILMSATLNAAMFAAYFGGCPTAHIPGFTFDVKEHFLDDVLEQTGFRIPATGGGGGGGGRGGGNPRRGEQESAMDLVSTTTPRRLFTLHQVKLCLSAVLVGRCTSRRVPTPTAARRRGAA